MVAQFVFTSVMLISTIIIAEQVNFMKSKDVGFDPINVIKITTPESKIDPNTLLERYLTKSFVEDATLAFSSPMDWSNWNNSYKIKGEEHIDGNNASMKFVDDNYMSFYDIPLLAGSPLKDQFINDTTYNVVVSKVLLETLGWNTYEDAIGRIITSGKTQMKIIGVSGDFNVHSVHDDIRPIILSYRPEMMKQIALRVSESDLKKIMADLEATFREIYPNELFEMSLFSSEISEQYMLEDLLHVVIQFVAFLSIMLSIMGLYGLVSFMANRNAKVIGIRKVFGASTGSILGIFTKEYIILMLISFLIASPMAYYLMDIWSNEFAFRIEITAKYFLIGFMISLVIALITVGYRSFIAARANPIKSLRYE